jgi:hypothetical protein
MSLRLSHQGVHLLYFLRPRPPFFLDSQQEIAIMGWLLTEKEENAIVFEIFRPFTNQRYPCAYFSKTIKH